MWHHKPPILYKFNCQDCPYSSNIKTNFQRHLNAHNADKPHWCEICHNGFDDFGKLRNHMVIHTGEECRFLPTFSSQNI